ncbi:MAG: hypothetical protein L0H63_13560 [Nitrococcus sp.]|nr:hypothetical protein [Nitrococcus sp.]
MHHIGYHLVCGIGCLFLALVVPAAAAEFGIVAVNLPPPVGLPGKPPIAAQQACTICHSGDYITTQPPLTRQQWNTQVVKMANDYGCPLSEQSIPVIVNWLVEINGKRE